VSLTVAMDLQRFIKPCC